MGNGQWSRVDGRNGTERRFDKLTASGAGMGRQASAEMVPDTFFLFDTLFCEGMREILPVLSAAMF
jgi:hypothetical protein